MNFSHKTLLVLAAVIFLTLTATSAKADSIIYQSAALGPTGQSFGIGLSNTQYLGTRFTIETNTLVTGIGGHLGGQGLLFGAIVQLSGPDALPSGNPFDGTVIAATTFVAGAQSSDFLTPLSANLGPGNYALIFGAGQFGSPADALGFMPFNNPILSGVDPFRTNFHWNVDLWGNVCNCGSTGAVRFVVASTPVPEPATIVLLGTGIAGIGAALRKRRRAVKEE